MIHRWPRRWRCHRSLQCCQYVDGPLCNSGLDPHWLGRMRFRRQWKRGHR